MQEINANNAIETGLQKLSPKNELGTKKQDNNIQAPVIELPKGGGAIKSIDEKFSVNAVNGTAGCSIPLPFSQARGFAPSLELNYNSGSGNGIFGLGWSLNLSSIRRKTEKELPQYFDAIDSDTYIISGAEDLVPEYKTADNGNFLTDANGNFIVNEFDIIFQGIDYLVRRYRPRIEGAFARIERWTDLSTGIIHWRIISTNNITSVYGKEPGSRIADPLDEKKIFEWFIEFIYDDKGNCTKYEYKKEDASGIDVTQAYNRNRLNEFSPFVNTYLKKILHGNVAPFKKHDDPIPTQFLFETVIDYGENDPINLPFNEITNWAFRSDAFSVYRSGFEIRTCRLCKRVMLYHYFDELPGGSALIRSLDFIYSDNGQEGFNFLVEASATGYTKHDDGSYTQKSFPPFSLSYQKLEWDTEVKTISTNDIINAPSGIDNSYQFIDLYSEGLSGILTEQGNNWFYKNNLGEGHFSPANPLTSKPSFHGLSNQLQLVDLEANGIKQLAKWQTEPKGFFELDEEEGWQSFKPFAFMPTINFSDPNTRLIDLNGDGLADVLITEENVFTWYASKGKAGYGSHKTVSKTFDEEKGPAIVFADSTQSIFLADMSGDGLIDIVRIRNGETCYWPNLGYGKFGAKISMDNAAVFDYSEQFNPSFIKLADIDGSGTSDIIYCGQNKIRIWLNQQGNHFSQGPVLINYFPAIDSQSNITVIDLLATGLSCIVWSSPLPQQQHAPLRYIDLANSKKPHLLINYKNNLGKETELEYIPSTKFYIDDKMNGSPWVTKLYFPVHCVSKVIVYDRIMKTRFASEYSYHHGYYDHIEREFRGFGRVDQKDSEDIAHFILQGSSNAVVEEDLQQPPVLTKTWFHTGAFINGEKILNQFAHEYFQNNIVPENLLPEPVLPAFLNTEEYRQALRACKGMMLRKEVYALDSSTLEDKPYAVEQHNCLIKILQPQGKNKYAVFITHESQAITYNYERNPADPRIAHSFIFDIDKYGNILQQASVVYGRKNFPDNKPEQEEIHIILNENQFSNDIIETLDYRAPLLHFSKSYELTGIPAPTVFYRIDELKTNCNAAVFIDHEVQPTSGIQKRLLGFARTQYRANDGITALSFGTIESKGLTHQSYKASFNQNMIADIFTPKISPATLQTALIDPAQGAYIFADNYYWMQSGIRNYDVDHFFLSTQFTDPFGNSTHVDYDNNYFLFVKKVTDALDNETQVVKFNYRVLSAYQMQDMNDNLSAVRFDELGMPVKSFIIGKKGIDAGDEFDDTKTEMKAAIDFPVTEMQYNLFEWYNQTISPGFDISNYKPQPNFVKTISRETHYHADPQHQTKFRESYSYSDGSGHTALLKAQAEPGEALQVNADGTVTTIPDTSPNIRWAGNGRTILNNKGNPVKQYEPYFSVLPSFDDEKDMVALGVTPVMQYDPPGRMIRTDFPNKTFIKVEFNPWQQISFDNNDTVKESEWYANLGSPDPSGPEPADADTRSAWLAAKHANTPSIANLDSLGRIFLTVADNGTEKMETKIKYDINGNQLEITDAMNRLVMQYKYTMTTAKWKQSSMDAGNRWMIADVAGKPLLSWDDRDHAFRFIYDALGRMTKSFLKNANANEIIHTQVEYGESISTAKTDNLRGKAYKSYDQSDIAVGNQFDFKGNALQATKQFLTNYKTDIDWTNPADLETEIFQNLSEYDALNRPIRLVTPNSTNMLASEIFPTYNEAGVLDKVDIKIRQAPTNSSFVTNINYNAKGQREQIIYGNNTTTKYFYQKETFRLIRLLTTRNAGAEILQDLNYTYDPVGNITQIKDNSQPDIFFDGEQVSALNQYEYDALYRLISATGRKQAGQTDIEPKSGLSGNNSFRNQPFINSNSISPNDAQAFRNYTEKYVYDKTGNMLQQQHISKNSSWTRTFIYDNGNNLNNRLTSTSIGPDTYTYNYDAHGNMHGLETLMNEIWDFADHFKQADLGGGGQAYYVYDSAGQRTRKIIERQDGSIKERIYLGTIEIYREKNSAGTITLERETLHVTDDKRRIAMVDSPTIKPSGSNEAQLIRYNYENHLSSASLELDDVAKIISYEEYFPYGTTSYSTIDSTREVSAKRYRYTGKERDEETGLNYHGARYYALWLCRWTSADPVGVGDGLNIFVYVSNNPINKIDFTGKWEFPTWDDAKKAATTVGKIEKGITDAEIGFVEDEVVPMVVQADPVLSTVNKIKNMATEEGRKTEAENSKAFLETISSLSPVGAVIKMEESIKQGDSIPVGIAEGVNSILKPLPFYKAGSGLLEVELAVKSGDPERIANTTTTTGLQFIKDWAQTVMMLEGAVEQPGPKNIINPPKPTIPGGPPKPLKLVDTDLIIKAAEKGDAKALQDIRSGTPRILPQHLGELLDVTSEAQRVSLQDFLKAEGIEVFQSSKKWLLVDNPEAMKVFDVAQEMKHSVADSVFAAVSKATGIEAITAEKRLSNLFNLSYPKLGVPIRRGGTFKGRTD